LTLDVRFRLNIQDFFNILQSHIHPEHSPLQQQAYLQREFRSDLDLYRNNEPPFDPAKQPSKCLRVRLKSFCFLSPNSSLARKTIWAPHSCRRDGSSQIGRLAVPSLSLAIVSEALIGVSQKLIFKHTSSDMSPVSVNISIFVIVIEVSAIAGRPWEWFRENTLNTSSIQHLQVQVHFDACFTRLLV
jgi:hypothetical protein